MNNRLTIRLIV